MADASRPGDAQPELRSSPPWVMQEMIAAQPALAEQILGSPSPVADAIAAEIAAALEAGRAVRIVGCGTSEHAAHGIAALIAAAVPPARRALVRARPALSAAVEPIDGVCVAVSHDGETRATELAVDCRPRGRRPHDRNHPAGVLERRPGDRSRARHAAPRRLVVPYRGLQLGAARGRGDRLPARRGRAQPAAARALLRDATGLDARPVAECLAGCRVVLCAGAGADEITARELALKIAEGARMPTLGLELETVLHGQLAGHEPADALVLIAIADGAERDRIARRTGQVAAAAAAIGLPVAALLSASYDRALAPELTPAGRLVVGLPEPALLGGVLAGLLAGAGALQALTLRLAHARDINPDLIRREVTRLSRGRAGG